MNLIRRQAVLAVIASVFVLLAGVRVSFAADDARSFSVEVIGHGPAMVLIPGLSSSGATWNSTVEHYRQRFECHVVTLAGFAGRPAIESPLIATARRELAEYVRALQRPVIVGHSLGGSLAMAIAIDHPELVGPAVVVDSLPFLGGAVMGVDTAEAAAPQLQAMRRAFATMSQAQYDQVVQSGTTTRFMVRSDADHDVVKRWAATSDPRTVGNAMADVYALDLRSSLGAITAPVLVLGTWIGMSEQAVLYNTVISRAQVLGTFAAQFSALRPLHFVLSETSRHFIMLDEPAWLLTQMDRFLADPSAAVRDRGIAAPAAAVR